MWILNTKFYGKHVCKAYWSAGHRLPPRGCREESAGRRISLWVRSKEDSGPPVGGGQGTRSSEIQSSRKMELDAGLGVLGTQGADQPTWAGAGELASISLHRSSFLPHYIMHPVNMDFTY